MIKRFTALLVAIVAIAALATGCGDDEASGDEDNAVTTSSLSKDQYIKKVNKICADGDIKAGKKLNPYLTDPKISEEDLQAAITRIVLQDSADQLEKIRKLGAPKGDEPQVEEVLVAMQQGLDESENKGVKTAEEFIKEFALFDQLALKYGIKRCIFAF